jgi:HSP20 family protein
MRDTIVRWEPFRDLASVQVELNRLFDRTFAGAPSVRPSAGSTWIPSMDVVEAQDRIVATLELPGIAPDQVEISIEDSTLTVSGTREQADEVEGERYHRVERRYGAFRRSIALPESADADRVEARFDKGVLAIEVPKVEPTQPKKIEIKAE